MEGSDSIESKEPAMDGFASYDHHSIKADNDTGEVYSIDLNNQYLTSSKLIYLSGCEIDLNAAISGYQGIKNDEGFAQEYSIPIKVRLAMEQRYNEFLMKRIGDFVVSDMDLPKSNEDNPGELRTTIWDADEANDAATLSPADDRLDVELMRRGMISPKQDDVDGYESFKKRREPNSLGTSRYRDQNKSSLLDPWLNMGAQKAEQLAGQANQLVNAGKSALESWTDVSKLNQSIVDGIDSLTNRLLWGNMFEFNLQDFASEASSFVAGMSSNNVVNQVTRGGWTHKDRSNPNNREGMGTNVSERSNSPNGNFVPDQEAPSGNIFE